MLTVRKLEELEKLDKKNTAVALGCFDGVHIGHAKILQLAKSIADDRKLSFAVYSFKEPPKNFFSTTPVPLITSFEEKESLMKNHGVEILVCPDFNSIIAAMSPEEFFYGHILDRLGAKHIICGYNYRFGKSGQGDATLLASLCRERGIELTVVPEVIFDGEEVSSSSIRRLLLSGEIKKANSLLGRTYSLKRPVVDGQHLGRTLGFPTINQTFEQGAEILARGVYATKTRIDTKVYRSITNVGTRPTVDGSTLCAETNIFDYEGDLYGRTLTVEFIEFLRPEVKFSSLDELKAQVESDIKKVKELKI